MKQIIVLICVLTSSCSYQQTSESLSPHEKMIKSHGGLETWHTFETLTFNRTSSSDTAWHIVDLKTRDEIMTDSSSYTVIFKRDKVLILPDEEAFGASDPVFYKNLWPYFYALPFLSADPGVNKEYLGETSFNGTSYDRIRLTFNPNTGDSPDDQYILWINKNSGLLDWINYSVTYFDKENATKYNAIVYDGWEEVDGLKMPTGFVGYQWNGDTIGNERYRYQFLNASFSKESTIQNL